MNFIRKNIENRDFDYFKEFQWCFYVFLRVFALNDRTRICVIKGAVARGGDSSYDPILYLPRNRNAELSKDVFKSTSETI